MGSKTRAIVATFGFLALLSSQSDVAIAQAGPQMGANDEFAQREQWRDALAEARTHFDRAIANAERLEVAISLIRRDMARARAAALRGDAATANRLVARSRVALARFSEQAAELDRLRQSQGHLRAVEIATQLRGDSIQVRPSFATATRLESSASALLASVGEVQFEDARNTRQESDEAFQNFDTQAEELYRTLATVLKSMQEMRLAVVRNLL